MIVLSGMAHAEPSAEDRSLATALFRQGKDLLDKGEVARACSALSESQRLDPGGGTLLNLALCHEREGKLATAWTEFHEARDVSVRDGRPDRAEAATRHIKDIEKSLPHVVLVVPPEARIPGLEIRRDDRVVPEAAWSAPIPIDPGTHTIAAFASGRKAWQKSISVKVGATENVTIPALEASDAPVPPLTNAPPPSAAPSTSRPGEVTTATGRSSAPVYVAGGATIIAAALGSVFGLRALHEWSTVKNECPDLRRCGSEGQNERDTAARDADIATIAFAVTAVAAGATVYLLVTRRADGEVALTASPRGLMIRGAW